MPTARQKVSHSVGRAQGAFGAALTAEPPLYDDGAALCIVVDCLAMQAVQALVGVDLSFGVNGLDHALSRTALAR